MIRSAALKIIVAIGIILATSALRAEANDTMPDKGRKYPDCNITKLEFRHSKVSDAIRLISELSGINAVATEEARKKEVSLYLQNVTAREAMDSLARISGLWYREDKETGTFKFMTAEEFQKEIVVFRDDVTKVFNLLHHNTVSMAHVIADLYGPRVVLSLGEEEEDGMSGTLGFGGAGISTQASQFSRSGSGSSKSNSASNTAETEKLKEPLTSEQMTRIMNGLGKTPAVERGEIPSGALKGVSAREHNIYVTVVRQHNAIVVRTDDARALEDIQGMIKELDRPTPQVLLEMKILKLSMGDSFRSVFDLGLTKGQVITGPATGQVANPLVPAAGAAAMNVLGLGNFPLEGGTFVYQFMNDFFRARIQLFAEENRIEAVATPMILASNNRPARIFVGEQRVLVTGMKTNVITPANGASTTFIEPVTEVRDIGTTLMVQPKINADRSVTLFISQDASSVLSNSATIPVATATGDVKLIAIDTVDTAIMQGTIVAKDGLTIAVGGLIQKSKNRNQQKVPWLGDLPLIGKLFQRDVKDEVRTELVLVITPHVLMTPEEGSAITETRLKALSEHSAYKTSAKKPASEAPGNAAKENEKR
jgi:type II secretory pathway component GspD/PulD (secretin)